MLNIAGLTPLTALAAVLLHPTSSARAFEIAASSVAASRVLPRPLFPPLAASPPPSASAASAAAAAAAPSAMPARSAARSSAVAASRRREADDDDAFPSKNINNSVLVRIGIIGGGAAGLAAARAFLRANKGGGDGSTATNDGVRFEVTLLEARDSIGGIWKYEEGGGDSPPRPPAEKTKERPKKSRPMYRNLRTNLPRELMAFREHAWGGDGREASYVTHGQVQQYLEEYAKEFDLSSCIRFGCSVNLLKVMMTDDGDDGDRRRVGEEEERDEQRGDGGDSWPKISLEWTDRGNNDQKCQRTFDGVCICNGHYAHPSFPPILGLENFRGTVMHAVEYDDPNDYAGKTVLCIGARASGGDIAREIGSVAHRVYLSDSTCDMREEYGNNVIRMPRTTSVGSDGEVHFTTAGGGDEEWTANDVDVIIFCSGYDYSFPFVTEESNLELTSIPGERRVRPLYEQLWHAIHPSLSFVGLPHSVVPFPFFEFQSDAVVAQWKKPSGAAGRRRSVVVPLPPLSERMVAADRDAISGGPAAGGPPPGGRVTDTHYLGSYQWDYCRRLSRIGGTYDDSMENFIETNRAIYDRSQVERMGMTPGGSDLYRETRFRRLDDERSYEILHSEIIEPAKVKIP